MNLELLFFLLKGSVFIYLSLGCGIIIFSENKRRGLFLLFASIGNLIVYYIWKNKLKISDPSFLTDKEEFVMSIFIFTAIGFVIVAFFFGNKVIDEELYGEALKIKEKIKDKINCF